MSTKELCRQTGITLRQAQCWCEMGLLRPVNLNHFRFFDATEVLIAAMIAELRRKGVPLQKIRRLPLRKLSGDFLVVGANGKPAAVWCNLPKLIGCVAKAPGPVWCLGVEDLRRRVYG